MRTAPRGSASERWLLATMVAAFAAIMVYGGGFWSAPPSPADQARARAMAQARASNAAVAVRPERRGRARPFRFRGGEAERAQAVECLATAALYEAGDDARGQRAVIQVILNRVRAPGFPGTVCGVVYQGNERETGCQFSFSCDGSVERRPIRLGWAEARRTAGRALSGHVFAPIGSATHYHADWMVPYWRDSLIKVARVGSHLFYVQR